MAPVPSAGEQLSSFELTQNRPLAQVQQSQSKERQIKCKIGWRTDPVLSRQEYASLMQSFEKGSYTSPGMMASGKMFTLKYMWNPVTHDRFGSWPHRLAAEKASGDSCGPDVVNSHEWRDSALFAANGAQCQCLQLIYSSSGQQLQKQCLAYITVMRPIVLSVFQLNRH